MRTIVGLIVVLGLAVAVAQAQPPRERAASFRPPEPLGPNDRPPGPVARGASEESPPAFPSTPVARQGKSDPARGPAWLTGVDPSVVPAAGNAPTGDYARTLSSAPSARERDKENPFTLPKGLEKLRGGSRTQSSAPQQPAEQPTAATPFRGTAANGAPVYAGPPAYRWYGWGTVTPGANQFAPTGQYPKASANWYSITGATPGAFPVPVMNPLRTPPGTEPPSYASARPSGTPATVISASGVPAAGSSYIPAAPQVHSQPHPQPHPQPLPVERPQTSKFNPTGESKFAPTEPTSPPVNVPKLTPPPATVALTPSPLPVLPPIVPETAVGAPPAPQSPAPKPQAVAVAPPVVPQVAPSVVIPPPEMPAPAPMFPSVEPPKPAPTDVPGALPMSVRSEPKPVEPARPVPPREEQKWQASPEPAQPAPGTWAPAAAHPTQPPAPAPAPTTDAPAWKSSSANVKPIVARGAAPDSTPDPIETLIQQLCRGRASGIEIRWAGTKKLMVCFEVRTPAEAQQLVSDISKRPELAPYQIDFCAVLKK